MDLPAVKFFWSFRLCCWCFWTTPNDIRASQETCKPENVKLTYIYLFLQKKKTSIILRLVPGWHYDLVVVSDDFIPFLGKFDPFVICFYCIILLVIVSQIRNSQFSVNRKRQIFCNFLDLHSGENSESVANQNVQNDVVPPAFVEVRQQMTKRNL